MLCGSDKLCLLPYFTVSDLENHADCIFSIKFHWINFVLDWPSICDPLKDLNIYIILDISRFSMIVTTRTSPGYVHWKQLIPLCYFTPIILELNILVFDNIIIINQLAAKHKLLEYYSLLTCCFAVILQVQSPPWSPPIRFTNSVVRVNSRSWTSWTPKETPSCISHP